MRLSVVTLKHETRIAGSERSRMLDRRIRDPLLRDTARILIVEQARTKRTYIRRVEGKRNTCYFGGGPVRIRINGPVIFHRFFFEIIAARSRG